VSINYINLATAKSANRANEVGIRKTMGAQKKHLVRQFLGESVMISLLAMVLGIILVELLLPVFNHLVDKNLTFTAELVGASGRSTLLIVLAVAILIGLISGIFPAFVLSRYKALRIAGRNYWNLHRSKTGRYSLNLRKGLVVFQFTVTASMIIATLIVFTQMHFMRSRDLGFDKERVVVIDIPSDRSIRQQLEAIKAEMKKVPGVTDLSASVDFPGYENTRLTFYIEEDGKYRQEMINLYQVDDRFADMLDIDMLEGRFFSKDHPSDATSAFVINEAAKKIFGDNPIGQKMACAMGVKGQIVGVTSNFNYSSLHNPIEPLVYLYKPAEAGYLGLKISSGNIPGTLKSIQEAWKKFDNKHPYQYSFLDAQFDSQYKREEKMVSIFGYFSLLTILLACLGLFGLSAFMAERRRKEIGIRKVMGSNAGLILRSFLKDYTLWVLLSNVIAWPLSYYLMERWLQNFAYRTPVSYYLFLTAAGITLLLAVATVSYHALKAANTNPADVLRDE
jgi:putative ABC transport system permease protein